MKEEFRLFLLRKLILLAAVVFACALFSLAPAPSGQNNLPLLDLASATSVQAKGGVREKIVFAAEGSIYVVNSDGTGLQELIPAAANTVNITPSWSPDGSQIAFASNRDSQYPNNLDIYVMQADGSSRMELADLDGRPRALLGADADGSPGLVLLGPSGSARAELRVSPSDAASLVLEGNKGSFRAPEGRLD